MNRFELLGIALVFFFFMSSKTSNLFFAGFAIFVILVLRAIRWWRVYVKKQLTASIKLHHHRIFPGEQVKGELILENQGFLPVFGIEVFIEYWDQCVIESDYLNLSEHNTTGTLKTYHGVFNLGSKERRRIPINVIGTVRGAYSFRGIRLKAKDPFGLDVMEKEVSFFEELLVYPNEVEIQELNKTDRIPQGDSVVRRWIHDDIFFPVGSRPYQPGDTFNRIDFKSTAKLQRLHTRQFDYTAHGDICVIANILTSNYKWMFDRDFFERTLSIVARISRESLQKDLRLSFFSNAQIGTGMRSFEIPSSSGRIHYRKILEILARFSFIHATPLSIVFSKVRQRYPNGALAVVITSLHDDSIAHELNLLLRQGFEIYLIDSSQETPTVARWTYASRKVRESMHG